MEKDNILENRTSPDYIIEDPAFYAAGILDITEFLFVEMIDLLKLEDRCFGIVKSYIHSIRGAYSKVNQQVAEEDIEIYDRLLFLYKPLIIREFKRLKNKHLSPADACITILHRLLDIISDVPNFEFKAEHKTIKKVIGKLWDNIRNNAKKDPLYHFSELIRDGMKDGIVGKYPLAQINLKDVDRVNPVLKNPGERMKEENNKVMEIKLV
jgi:hypothetical protein